jgi:hypothetical protein
LLWKAGIGGNVERLSAANPASISTREFQMNSALSGDARLSAPLAKSENESATEFTD